MNTMNTEFELFDELLNVFQAQYEGENDDVGEEALNISECKHLSINSDGTTEFCVDCGLELEKKVYQDKEWRYYNNTNKGSDPTRVISRKNDDKNIFKDVENMGFSDKIINSANQIYQKVSDTHIYRGKIRKSLIFASIFHAYKQSGKAQSPDKLIQIFNISRKNGIKGLNHSKLNKSCIKESNFVYTGANLKMPITADIKTMPIKKIKCNSSGEWSDTMTTYDEYLQYFNEKEQKKRLKQRYNTFLIFQSGHVILSSINSEYAKDSFYSFINTIKECKPIIQEKLDT